MHTMTAQIERKIPFLPDANRILGRSCALQAENDSGELATSPKRNHLLAALPSSEYQRLFPFLMPVQLSRGQVIHESGDHINAVYFPINSIISLQQFTEEGASMEISIVGNEGMLGVTSIMGGKINTNRAVVQNSGIAFRLNVSILKDEFDRFNTLNHLLLRYTQALITQMSQMAVCNRHHTLEQQLCSRLLFSLDRLPCTTVTLTHELISNILGVRRESVSVTARKLQMLGMIRYRRGQIHVLDRQRLEQTACECYALVKNDFDLMFHAARVN